MAPRLSITAGRSESKAYVVAIDAQFVIILTSVKTFFNSFMLADFYLNSQYVSKFL